MSKIRVLVVDDSVVIRRMLTDCLQADPDIEVVGTAPNGLIGLAKIEQLAPELVTLDMEMPVMDGLATVKAIRKMRPRLPVIMFSTLTERGATSTLDALSLGANDYVTKPANVGSVGEAIQRIHDQLLPKIKALCRPNKPPSPLIEAARPAFPGKVGGRVDILAIGVSTGGPNALAALLPGLDSDFPVPILIVQHMPPLFTRMLAERISTVTGRRAREGEAGVPLNPGEIWLAPGGMHMEATNSPAGPTLLLHDGPQECSCRPSVDVLFRSVAQVYGGNVLAVVLTGMGHDGLAGSRRIREAGGQVLAQDEESSVVWGMPGAVCEANLAQKILPLDKMATAINQIVQAGAPQARMAWNGARKTINGPALAS